jgi:hypothetical protein
VIEEVTIVDPEANPEEPEGSCERLDQHKPEQGLKWNIPSRRCLSREERREAIRVEMLEERRKK